MCTEMTMSTTSIATMMKRVRKKEREKKTIATKCAYGTKHADMLPNANDKNFAYKSISMCVHLCVFVVCLIRFTHILILE